MKTGKLLATVAATLIAGAILNAQTPPADPKPGEAKPGDAKPAETKPAEAKPASDPAKTPETKPATEPLKKGKPFSAIEQRSYSTVCEALQFNMKMAERAIHKKDDKLLNEIGAKVQSQTSTYWKPIVGYGEQRVKDTVKDIPQDMSKSDKDELGKVDKEKDEKKWRVEFLELFAKNAKRNSRTVQAALKALQDGELKTLGPNLAKALDGQAEQIEAAYKEAKNPKKDEKKK